MPRSAYVVSQDLRLLLDRWTLARFGRTIALPYEQIRTRLAEILAFADHDVVMITEEAMSGAIADRLRDDPRPIVSVDPVYRPGDFMVHVTRCVRDDHTDVPGLHPRPGYADLEAQFGTLASALGVNGIEVPVTLVDDVVYSGDVVKFLITSLRPHGIRVERVVCGIAVVQNEEKDPFKLCRGLDAELLAGFVFGTFDTPKAVDEICERDFFVFVPMCGRSAVSNEVNLGYPYIEPFGDAYNWASFEEHAPAVSRQLIELNVRVLEMIEAQLGRDLLFSDLDRYPVRVRHPDVAGDSVRLHLLAHLG
ncbi:hypothetical protein HZA87_02580 [Candidatus Uhrbacteria bacterium]|nr:hypothetical protein [Candidatus Uhrbacteria bacterium]